MKVHERNIQNSDKTPLSCIIVDDEKDNLDLLEYLISQSGFDIQVMHKIQCAKEALEILKIADTDIVFMDIKMPELSGFDVLSRLEKWHFFLVFVTAYDNFAIQALRAGAFDYLLKPVIQDDLNSLLKRYVNDQVYTGKKNEADGQIKSNITSIHYKSKKLYPGINDYFFLDLNQVVCFEADSSMTIAVLKSGERIYLKIQLKQLEADLIDLGFYRIHKSFLINLMEISKITKKEGLTVVMSNNTQIPVSRVLKNEFMDRINSL